MSPAEVWVGCAGLLELLVVRGFVLEQGQGTHGARVPSGPSLVAP